MAEVHHDSSSYFLKTISLLLLLFIGVLLAAQNHQSMLPESSPFYCPFLIHIDPMERLLLINFEKDPDSIYVGFEPQVFDDKIHGKGLLVIGWRRDLKVDVYYEPGLQVKRETFDIAGAGANEVLPTDFTTADFRVTSLGVSARIKFTDCLGRIVDIAIEESNKRKRKPFGLLAPMGEAAQTPSALPLVYLHDFYFVRRRSTVFSVQIDGRLHKPDKAPMAIDFMRMYFSRYSPDPLIVTLNPAAEQMLDPVPDIKEADFGSYSISYNFIPATNGKNLENMVAIYRNHEVKLTFDPPFPDITRLKEDSTLKGSFHIKAHESTGSLQGGYSLQNRHGKVFIELSPSGGWKPVSNKPSLWFLYRVASVFRNWPKSYVWTAEIDIQNMPPKMRSSWQKTTAK